MAKRMVTRSITAPMIYTAGMPQGLHVPGSTLRSAEIMAQSMGQGEVAKVVMETHIYEMEEEVFLKYAHIKQPKPPVEEAPKSKKKESK